MNLIQTDDLDDDPGVCSLPFGIYSFVFPSGSCTTPILPSLKSIFSQCVCYCLDLFAFFFGFCVPMMVGSLLGDALGGFIWGGLVARVCSMFK